MDAGVLLGTQPMLDDANWATSCAVGVACNPVLQPQAGLSFSPGVLNSWTFGGWLYGDGTYSGLALLILLLCFTWVSNGLVGTYAVARYPHFCGQLDSTTSALCGLQGRAKGIGSACGIRRPVVQNGMGKRQECK